MPDAYTIREHERFRVGDGLDRRDLDDLKAFARHLAGLPGEHRHLPVLEFDGRGGLRTGNHVGVITTKRGTVVEILPKIHLGQGTHAAYETTRETFLGMLRVYRGLKRAANLPPSAIRALRRFPMLEVFVRTFLENVRVLVTGGLSRRYVPVRENLPFLRGRIVFRDHLRENLIDRSRFHVEHDELSPNRPANRLIRTALERLKPVVRNEGNRRLLKDLKPAFSAVPPASDPRGDWQSHSVDRSMPHYGPVMRWVGLFLFNRGLATWSGRHVNQSLLFPMEEVFEDFLTHSFRRHQSEFQVIPQGPRRHMASKGDRSFFAIRPDISLRDATGAVRFVLDAKWKHVGRGGPDLVPDIVSSDVYQLYAYGKRYGCRTVALAYPRSAGFASPFTCRFFDDLRLACLPFDVPNAEASVRTALRTLATT